MPLSVLIALVAGAQTVPPVPGGCSEPAAEHVGEAGCYLSGTLEIAASPSPLFWHIVPATSERDARGKARGHRSAFVTRAHGRWWLYVLSPDPVEPTLGAGHHVAGPISVPAGARLEARFMESWFPPGMRTRVHQHAGPEVFYLLDGEQCTETPSARHRIRPGESYIVAADPHLQAAPRGRRSVVLILSPPGEPWMALSEGWPGTGYCDR